MMTSTPSFISLVFLWARFAGSWAKIHTPEHEVDLAAGNNRQNYWAQRRNPQTRRLYTLQHFTECMSNFHAADSNQDEQLSMEEFTVFAQLQLNQEAPVPFAELDADLTSIFYSDACLCPTAGCCSGENAHIDFNPHKPDFLESIFFVCKAFEELAPQAPSIAPSPSTEPTSETKEVAQASLIGDVKSTEDAKQEGAAMSEAQKAILTLSLFCISFLIVIVMAFLFVQGAISKRKSKPQPTVAAVLDSPEKDQAGAAWPDRDTNSNELMNLHIQGTWPASSPSAFGDEENPAATPNSQQSDPFSTTAILASQKKKPLKNRLQQLLATGWNDPIATPSKRESPSNSSKSGDSMAMQYPTSPLSLKSTEASSPKRMSMRFPQNLSPIPYRQGRLRDDTPMIVTPSRRSLVPFGQQGLVDGSPSERWHNEKLSGPSSNETTDDPSAVKRGLDPSSAMKSSKKPNLNATPIKPKTISFSVQNDENPLETPTIQRLDGGDDFVGGKEDLLTRTGARKLPCLADDLQTPKTPSTLKDSSYVPEMEMEPTPVESPPPPASTNAFMTRSVARVGRSLADELGKTPQTVNKEAAEDTSTSRTLTLSQSKCLTPMENPEHEGSGEANPEGSLMKEGGYSVPSEVLLTRSVARVGASLADTPGETPKTISKSLEQKSSDSQNRENGVTASISSREHGSIVRTSAVDTKGSEESSVIDTPHAVTPRPTNTQPDGHSSTLLSGKPHSSSKRPTPAGNIFQFFPNSLKKTTQSQSQDYDDDKESRASPMEGVALYQPPQLSATKTRAYDMRLQYNAHPFGAESDLSEKDTESSLDRGVEKSLDRDVESSLEHDAEHEEGFHTDTGSYASSGFFGRLSPLRDPPQNVTAFSSPSSKNDLREEHNDEGSVPAADNEHEIEFQTDRDTSVENPFDAPFSDPRHLLQVLGSFHKKNHSPSLVRAGDYEDEDDTFRDAENNGVHQGVNLVHAFNTPIKRSPLRESSGNFGSIAKSRKSSMRKTSIASPDPPGRVSETGGHVHGTPTRPSIVSGNEIVFRLEDEHDHDNDSVALDGLEAQMQSPDHLFQVIDSIHRYHMSREQHNSSLKDGAAPWWRDDDGE